MPPQPLTRAQKRMGISLGQPGQPSHQIVSDAVFHVVNLWSQIDMNLASMLCAISREDLAIDVGTIYDDKKSLSLRQTAIEEVAAQVLPEHDACLIKATLQEFKPSQKVRNRFCHGIWGVLSAIPDAWLLMKMESAVKYDVEFARLAATGSAAQAFLDTIDISVWRERDLREAVEGARLAHERLTSLKWAVGPMQKSYLRDRILETGFIRARYDKLMAAAG